MRPHYQVIFFILPGIILLNSGCQNPQEKARQALAGEISRRQDRQAESRHLYEQGLKACQKSDWEQAHQYLRQAIDTDEKNVYAWMTLGRVEFQRDKLYEAAFAFQRAARLMPQRYEPHFNIGSVLEAAGYHQKAILSYEKALELAPEEVEVMENLARCYIKTRQKQQKARELLEQALLREQRPEWQAWLEEQTLSLNEEGKANKENVPN